MNVEMDISEKQPMSVKMDKNEKQPLFDVIGNECRREILRLLVLEPHYVSQLSKILDKSQPAILKHMKVLEDKGLVTREKVEADKDDKGPERHYFRVAKSFCVIYSVSPHNVRELVFDTSEVPADPSHIPVLTADMSPADKISTINGQIEQINQEMTQLEEHYVALEAQRNRLLELANDVIDQSDELHGPTRYVERQLLRRHVCESRTCVQEISALLKKKEEEVREALALLRDTEYLNA